MRLALLGQIAIITDTGAITALPHRATWRLLARLALAHESTLPRSELEAILQSEGSVRAPNTLLRQLLFRLREKLSTDILVREEGSLRLVIPCDAAEFVATIRKAERAREESYRQGLLQRSIALYAGSFMPGFKETWAEELAEELEAKYLWAKAELGLAEEEEGEERMSVKLVGRGQELARLEELLSKERFVTLVGPGGAGKTRLARELVRKDRASVVVNLVEVTTAEAVVPAILSAVGLPPSGSIEAYFSSRPEALLVLDNAEHLVSPELRGTLSQLLTETETTGLRLLTTSRRALDTPFEHVFPLGMLPTPPEKPAGYWAKNRDALLAYPSAQLFCEQAKRTKRGWDIAHSGDNIAEICRRVDGSPLALLLIASRVNVFNPTELATKKLFALLEAKRSFPGDRERHGSLREVINWSVAQLSPSQTAVFASLSEFAGSFSTEAAQYITDTPHIEQDLESLAAENLLERDDSDKARPRWRFHQTIKERALELVEQLATGDTTRQRFLRYYRDLTERAAPHLRTRRGKVWLDHLEQEHDNLKKAIAVAETDDALHIISSLLNFYRFRGHFLEGIATLEKLIALKGDQAPADAYITLANLRYTEGDHVRAVQAAEIALAKAKQAGDEHKIARSMSILGNARHSRAQVGDLDSAEQLGIEVQKLGNRLGDKALEAGAYNSMALRPRDKGDLETARKLHEKSLELFRSIGDVVGEATLLSNLAKIHNLISTKENLDLSNEAALQEKRKALVLFHQSLKLWEQFGSRQSQAVVKNWMSGSTYFVEGQTAFVKLSLSAFKDLNELGEKFYSFECLWSAIAWFGYEVERRQDPKITLTFTYRQVRLYAAIVKIREGEVAYAAGKTKEALRKSFMERIGGNERFEQAWAEGGKLTINNVIRELKTHIKL